MHSCVSSTLWELTAWCVRTWLPYFQHPATGTQWALGTRVLHWTEFRCHLPSLPEFLHSNNRPPMSAPFQSVLGLCKVSVQLGGKGTREQTTQAQLYFGLSVSSHRTLSELNATLKVNNSRKALNYARKKVCFQLLRSAEIGRRWTRHREGWGPMGNRGSGCQVEASAVTRNPSHPLAVQSPITSLLQPGSFGSCPLLPGAPQLCSFSEWSWRFTHDGHQISMCFGQCFMSVLCECVCMSVCGFWLYH